MRYLLIYILILLASACNNQQRNIAVDADSSVVAITIPQTTLLETDSGFKVKSNLYYHNDSLYSGFIEGYSPAHKLISRFGFWKGQKQGIQQQWYENGQLKETRYYLANMKTGTHTGWWDNGVKRFEYVFDKDIPVKRHCQWYKSGKLCSLFEYNNAGQPEGAQQLWYEDGTVKSNYVVKDNRRFGFLGAKGCVMK